MIERGSYEAEKTMQFYTYIDGNIKDLGQIGTSNIVFYEMNNETYVLGVYGHAGYEETYKVYIEGDKIKKEVMGYRQINLEEGYTEGDRILKEFEE